MGSGAWGTALAMVLVGNGHQVTLWSHREEMTQTLRQGRESPRLQGVPLPEGLIYTSSLTSLPESELVVFATPSFALRQTARLASPCLREDAVLVSVTKGIEPETGLRMTEIVGQETRHRYRVVALSGPSHAEEVGRQQPTGVVAACADLKAAELVQDAFMCSYFRVYTNPDIVGVELGGALKNVIALSCGVTDGMGLGDNTKALMMTRGMTEMARLGSAMGGRWDTFAGLSGMGDLIVTCTSMHSRNRRAGILVGMGSTAQEAMEQVGAVVEGYYAAKSACELARRAGVEMPICLSAYQVLYERKSVHLVVDELMSRDRKRESAWID